MPKQSPIIVLTPKTSILEKAMRHMVLLALTIIVGLSLISFLFMRSFLLQRVLSQVQSAVASAEDTLATQLQALRLRTALLPVDASFRPLLTGSSTQEQWVEAFGRVKEREASLIGLALFGGSQMRASTGERIAGPSDPFAEGSVIRPVIDESGWRAVDVFVPVQNPNGEQLILGARYSTMDMLSPLLLSMSSIGETAQLLFAFEEGGELALLHPGQDAFTNYRLFLGLEGERYVEGLPLARALRGEEGTVQARDHRGQNVITAYRQIPSLGWGLAVQVDRRDVLGGVVRLGWSLGFVGGMLTVFAGFLAYLLSRELVGPLTSLTAKVATLQPGNWKTKATVHTGDEVELLDRQIVRMAQRLQEVYEHLEEMVASRTEELKRQYALDRTILEGITYGVVTTDANGKITGANPAAIRMLGWKTENRGESAAELLICIEQGKPLPTNAQPIASCLQTRRNFRSKAGERLSLKTADDILIPVTISASPLVQGKELFGAVIVFQDVRDERKMEDLKSEFITLASHQLRTPLSIVKWHMSLLTEEDHLNTSQKDSVHEMELATERMTNLLNALLEVAQLQRDGLTLKPEELDLHAFFRGEISQLQDLAKQASVMIKLDMGKEPLRVTTDKSLLSIAVQNLLTNAVKYSAKGGAMVRLSAKKDRGGVTISVEDKGLGIPDAEQKHLFEKFFRASNVRKIDTDGTGLGLYITKMIIESLGGTVMLASAVDKGTTFTVHLPLRLKKEA